MSKNVKPFSSGWLEPQDTPPEPPRRWNHQVNAAVVRALSWLPAERVVRALAVLLIVVSSVWMALPPAPQAEPQTARGVTSTDDLTFNDAPTEAPEVANIQTGNLEVTEDEAGNPLATPTPQPTQGPRLTLDLGDRPEVQDGSLLPANRLLLFYGFPGDVNMGILGKYDEARLLELMREQAAEYEAADPSRPVKIAFEVIASVAQPEPQNDGSFLLDTPAATLDRYADFAEQNDVYVFFDLQIGRRTVQQEVEGLEPWLRRPHVHLALDPEFSMIDPSWVPSKNIGSVHGADVTWTQNYLVNLTTTNGLPPKVLIVHQFTETMILEKDTIKPVTGVQLVIDMDGWGPPDRKRSTYSAVIASHPIEYSGIKLFYDQDKPVLSPADVLKLAPSPDVIIYQ